METLSNRHLAYQAIVVSVGFLVYFHGHADLSDSVLVSVNVHTIEDFSLRIFPRSIADAFISNTTSPVQHLYLHNRKASFMGFDSQPVLKNIKDDKTDDASIVGQKIFFNDNTILNNITRRTSKIILRYRKTAKLCNCWY